MQTIAEELSESGVSDDNIIFWDLDQRGYRGIKSPNQLEKLIEEKGYAKEKKYLFIDEIQNVTGFEELLNGFRSEGDWSIFITGSNSYLLSGEIATKLTGRYLEFELFPLSFEEYELMKAFYEIPLDPLPNNEMNQFILEGDGVDISNITYITRTIHNEIYSRCDPEYGDILLIKDGATTGVVTVNNIKKPFSMLSSVALLKTYGLMNPWYIVYVLRSDILYKTIREQMKGTGITRITLKQIEPILIPLPPLSEQQRIVEKIEALMPMVNAL